MSKSVTRLPRLRRRSTTTYLLDTPEKAEALERHMKTVLGRQEEAQRRVNEISAQLSQQRTTFPNHTVKNRAARNREGRREKHERTEFRSCCVVSSTLWSTRCPFLAACQSLKSGEWWFEVCLKGVGRTQPLPIDDICSVNSKLSVSPDATSARWYEAFASRVASSQSTVGLGRQAPNKRSLDRIIQDI